ncbi:MAG: efflux RND transporter periplasmic adaptor subunit [Planctomycetota bacterium]
MWKWLLGIALVLVLGCVGSGYWLASSGKLKEFQEQFNPAMKATEVRMEAPKRGDLVRTISAPGTIGPRTKVDISAQVSARIIALPLREGQRVRKGDVICKLDSVDLVAALDSAKARLGSAESRVEGVRSAMENADRTLRRQRELLSTKDISQSEFDDAQSTFDQSKSTHEQALRDIDIAKANIKRSEKDLANTTIASTIDGVVSTLNAEVGELVVVGTLNSPGSIIMQIADLANMLMKAKVDESNIDPVKPGQKCTVYINAFPGKPAAGEVERIRPTKQTDKDGTTFFETEIKVELSPENALTGMLANADIEVQTLKDIVKIPTQAIVDRSIEDLPAELVRTSEVIDRAKKFTRVVFRVVDGKAVATPVLVGPSDLSDTVILKGLTEKDVVVIGPYRALIALKSDQKVSELNQNESPKDTGPRETRRDNGGGPH